MTKKIIILILLILILGALLVFFIFNEKKISRDINNNEVNSDNVIKKIEVVDKEKLDSEYKEKVKIIMSEYFDLESKNLLNLEKINEISNKLLDLKVSSEFKEVHVNLILALTKMRMFYEKGDDNYKKTSQELIEKIIKEYSWIK